MRHFRLHQSTFRRRGGFTILELLVVITVISLMAALLAGASWRFVVGARETATATTIRKAAGFLDDRTRAFEEFDFTDAAIITTSNWSVNNSGDPIMTPALAEVLVRKTRFKKAFPQAFAELDTSQIARFFANATTFPPHGPSSSPAGQYDSKYEPGIVLYAVILKGETFGAATPADDTFTSAEVKIAPETGGLPCLVDAWGEPLRFYRWPTRLIQSALSPPTVPYQSAASLLINNLPPAVGTPVPLQIDPDDPTFKLSSWFGDQFASSSALSTRSSQFPVVFHDAFMFHVPLIISAGQDRQLGLYEPTDVPTTANPNSIAFGYLAAPSSTLQPLLDDITNLNQRAGGK